MMSSCILCLTGSKIYIYQDDLFDSDCGLPHRFQRFAMTGGGGIAALISVLSNDEGRGFPMKGQCFTMLNGEGFPEVEVDAVITGYLLGINCHKIFVKHCKTCSYLLLFQA